jgi:hypothetical protein
MKMSKSKQERTQGNTIRNQAKKHGDNVETLLKAAGAVREERSGSSLTSYGSLQPQFNKGDKVQVRVEGGSWCGGLRVISGIEEAEDQTGAHMSRLRVPKLIVWVAWEAEWQAAQTEGREPLGVPWPYEQVELWEPGWTLTNEADDVEESTGHSIA